MHYCWYSFSTNAATDRPAAGRRPAGPPDVDAVNTRGYDTPARFPRARRSSRQHVDVVLGAERHGGRRQPHRAWGNARPSRWRPAVAGVSVISKRVMFDTPYHWLPAIALKCAVQAAAVHGSPRCSGPAPGRKRPPMPPPTDVREIPPRRLTPSNARSLTRVTLPLQAASTPPRQRLPLAIARRTAWYRRRSCRALRGRQWPMPGRGRRARGNGAAMCLIECMMCSL
jgi:hypothetical protein